MSPTTRSMNANRNMAVEQVFENMDLFEHIMDFVPHNWLYKTKRTSKTFKDVVEKKLKADARNPWKCLCGGCVCRAEKGDYDLKKIIEKEV